MCIATPYRFLRLNNYSGLLGVKAWNGENAIYAIMWPILYTSILWNNMLLRASSAFAICNKPKIYTNFRRNFFAKNETTPPYMVALLLCVEPFLVDLMQSGFCEKTLYSYLAWVPQNPFWNLSIVVKMRGQFPKSVMKIHKTKVDWPCTCVVNFRLLPFAQFLSDLGKNWYAARF